MTSTHHLIDIMNSMLRRASLVAFLTLPLASSLSFASGPNHPEALPRDAQRDVIGIWRLRDSRCTRSIEQIADRFFMVSRCPHLPDVDGSVGFPLTRLTDQRYRNRSGVDYEIQADRHLLVMVNGEVFDRGVPQQDLWAK